MIKKLILSISLSSLLLASTETTQSEQAKLVRKEVKQEIKEDIKQEQALEVVFANQKIEDFIIKFIDNTYGLDYKKDTSKEIYFEKVKPFLHETFYNEYVELLKNEPFIEAIQEFQLVNKINYIESSKVVKYKDGNNKYILVYKHFIINIKDKDSKKLEKKLAEIVIKKEDNLERYPLGYSIRSSKLFDVQTNFNEEN